MKLRIVNHTDVPEFRGLRGIQSDGTYVTGYNPAYGTSRGKLITVDGIEFCASTATRDRGVWWIRNGQVERAPAAWHGLVSRLANVSLTRDTESGRLSVNGALLLSHFVDSHDDNGVAVDGGRPSGLHFPVIAPLDEYGQPEFPLSIGTTFLSGKLDGKPVVSIL